MTAIHLIIIIPGIKQSPAGSKTAYRNPGSGRKYNIVDDCKTSKDWKEIVRAYALKAAREAGFECTDKPVCLDVRFEIAHPDSHYRRVNGHPVDLKASAPKRWHTYKPDRGKLLRAIEDALTGLVYRDDAQVCSGTVEKRWGVEYRTEIVVTVHHQ